MRTTTARAGLTALALTGLIGLSGCSAIEGILGADQPERDESGEITEAGEVDAFAITVGDCLDVAALSGEVTTVPTVPCGEAHDGEVYARTDLPDGDYPGEDAIYAAADEYCLPEFATFIGVDYMESEIEYTPLTPSQGSWDGIDDREVLCIAQDITTAGGVTGSMAGAGR